MKIILNKCYGGFGLSEEAYELYAKKKGWTLYPYYNSSENNFTTFKKTTLKKGNSPFLTYYFIEDFGDEVFKNTIDWSKNLYLNYTYRNDPILIEVVEELGEKANGRFSNLVVVEIPDNMDYVIDDYDGIETLHENVRAW